MSRREAGKYLKRWIIALALIVLAIFGEIGVLNYTVLDQPNEQQASGQPGQKEGTCPENKGFAVTINSAERLVCLFVFKNLRFIERNHDTLNAISTLAVAIFTFTLWASTQKLWLAGENQRKFSERIAAEQARDMRLSLDIAKQSIEALQASERPHLIIGPSLIFLNSIARDGTAAPNALAIEWLNLGKGPAFLKEIYMSVFAAIELPDIPPPLDILTRSFVIIGPGRTEKFLEKLKITEEVWATGTATEGSHSLFVIGKIVYTDSFGLKHSANFAYKFQGHNEKGELCLVPCGPFEYWAYT